MERGSKKGGRTCERSSRRNCVSAGTRDSWPPTAGVIHQSFTRAAASQRAPGGRRPRRTSREADADADADDDEAPDAARAVAERGDGQRRPEGGTALKKAPRRAEAAAPPASSARGGAEVATRWPSLREEGRGAHAAAAETERQFQGGREEGVGGRGALY